MREIRLVLSRYSHWSIASTSCGEQMNPHSFHVTLSTPARSAVTAQRDRTGAQRGTGSFRAFPRASWVSRTCEGKTWRGSGTVKNAFGLIGGVCVVILAAMTILVPADKLATPPGRYFVIGVAILAIIGIGVQMFKQSHDDHNLGRQMEALLAEKGYVPDAVKSVRELQPEAQHSSMARFIEW